MESFRQYSRRSYRGIIEPEGLVCYRVALKESDLLVCTVTDMSRDAIRALGTRRSELETYMASHEAFSTSFRPVPATGDAPGIVKDMAAAAREFDVGPMASVAGAIAQWVGTDLSGSSGEVVVENGGDIFMAGGAARKVRIFSGAGSAPVDIVIEPPAEGIGVCTSSATVGPSVSLGRADAVTVIASTATLADAAATAIGNMVLAPDDVAGALEAARRAPAVLGAVVLLKGSMGAWGMVELA